MDVDFWSFPEKRGPTPAKLRTREKVGGFFSPEAGQARREWLNGIDDRIAEGLRYYLGPSGVDQKVTAAAQGGQMLMDGADFQDAYTAGGDLMQSRSIPEAAANFLEFAAPAAAVMIPGVSNRMLQGAGDMAEDAARFVVDESGALRLGEGKRTIDQMRESARARRAEREVLLRDLTADDKPIKMKSGDLSVLVSRASDRDGWRVTYFQPDGSPSGHVDAADKSAAVSRALEDQFKPVTPPTNALAPPSPAQQVADLLASGRASDVTDEMLAKLTPNDNAELFKLYQSGATGADMPMDVASRMARAEGMGVDTGTPLYHGTGADFRAFDSGRFQQSDFGTGGAGVYSSGDPGLAGAYSDLVTRPSGDGANVLPIVTRRNDAYDNGGYRNINSAEDSRAYSQKMQSLGIDNVFYRDGATGEIVENTTFDPRNIRSRFARFDPRLSHLANLSAAGAGVAVINGQDDLTPEEQFRRMWWAQQPQKGNSQ